MAEDPGSTPATGAPETMPVAASRWAKRAWARGDRIGRYTVLDELGTGGMGVVLRAHDPELRREVALKVVRTRARGGDRGAAADARLVREARAMAQLVHPNVLPVYHVDQSPDGVSIAMEFVDGETLHEWLRREERSWRDVLGVLVQAGRGLAAAHAAGLVHRDFKPANVLLDNAGRVLVTDFGLARPVAAQSSEGESADGGEVGASGATPITEAGTVVGTPPYMAPEQHRGDPAEASADQYAFCVALFEGLYGERPFKRRPGRRLLDVKLAGPSAVPPRRRVPRRLYADIARGLSPRAGDRFATMDDLLASLERHAQSSIVRRAVAVVAVVGVGGALGWAVFDVGGDRWPCTTAPERLEGVWDAERKQQVRAAFMAARASHATATLQRVEARLDDYADAWVAGHIEACKATNIRGEQSPAVLDTRMTCLAQRRWALGDLVDALAAGGAQTLERSIPATLALPEVSRCGDVEALVGAVPVPDARDTAQTVAQLRRRLAAIGSQAALGSYAEAADAATELLRQAESLAYEPLLAEIESELGSILMELGRHQDARELCATAYETAVRTHHDRIAARAATQMLYVVGFRLSELDEAERWRNEAKAWVARVDPVGALAIELAKAEALVDQLGGNLDASRAEAQRAIAMSDALRGPDHPKAAFLHDTLGNTLRALGRFEEAEHELRRGLELRIESFGSEHPLAAIAENNLALVAQVRGDYARAEASFRHAITVWEGSGLSEDPRLANAYNNLGSALYNQDRTEDAIAAFREAAERWERLRGPDHPKLAETLANLGTLYKEVGRYDESHALQKRALAIFQRKLGPEHSRVAAVQTGLGRLKHKMGRLPEALEHYDEALEIWEAALGSDHPKLAHALTGRGDVLIDLGRATEAVPLLERAVSIRRDAGVAPGLLASTEAILARAREG